jgi:hypothetical protein
MVTRSNATVIAPLRSRRPAFVTPLTIPRITDPAGTTTRPLASRRSTSVVASKRSSSCAVAELSELCSRTSNSVPTGTSSSLDRPIVDVGAERVSGERESGHGSSAGRLPGGGVYPPVDSPRARDRMFSMRSRRSMYSLWEIGSCFRSFTRR